MTTTAETIEAVAAGLGLTMTAEFVPWSKSRNAGEKQPSLNWKVKILKDGREVLTTDYMAGSGHCPAYKASVKELGGRDSLMRDEAIRWECENGKAARVLHGISQTFPGKPLLPDFAGVLHGLCLDADAIDYRDFDEWAGNFGYDADSRKAEAIYRVCLEIGLKLRSALGEDGLTKLREACQDY